jgi:tRNA-specific 2-thiouridylase
MTKQETRAIAEAAGLPTAQKPESQEICFIPDGNYSRFIDRYLEEQKSNPQLLVQIESLKQPQDPKPGDIVTVDGKVLGEHTGIHRYTVGQRRGIGISAPEPLYVVKVDAEKNQVVVGSVDHLLKREMIVTRPNWIAIEMLTTPLRVSVKIRSRAEEATAMISPHEDGNVLVTFDEAQRAITPGQAAVFYDDEVVVGGGWIG